MTRKPVAAFLPVLCFVALSCTSGDEALPSADASADVAAPPDAAADVTIPDAGIPVPEPLDVVCTTTPCYVSVSGSGGRHVCGLVSDGTVRCWGRDSESATPNDGALGRGAAVSLADGAMPAPVVGLSDVTQLSVGPNLGTCARKSDGTVSCWGRNEFGQLGRPPTEPRLAVPTRVDGLPPVDEVRLGAQTACAVSSTDRVLYCWGAPMPGLGVAGGKPFAPRAITTFRPPLKAVVMGTWGEQDTVIALLDGDVLASAGALPAGERSVEMPPERPIEVPGVARIGAFAYVTRDGLLARWRLTSRPFEAPMVAYDTLYVPSSAQIIDVKASGANQSEQGGALLATGRLFRWGVNTAGALGVDPDDLPASTHPLEMTRIASRAVSFATTFGSTCVSLVNGSVECWGTNAYGELGRGIADAASHPEPEVIR